MIQRKQTLFLLVAAILGLVFWLSWSLFVIQALASALSLYTIFIYKKRPRQATLGTSSWLPSSIRVRPTNSFR